MKITPGAFAAGTISACASIAGAEVPSWDVFADTWVATDGLGRALPTHEQVGPPRAHRTVGIFYFPWVGQHQGQGDKARGPFDVSKILAAHPEALQDPRHPAWGGVHAYHWWGEPLFGYYVAHDPFVQRKHAQMLADAGVDTLVFDTSNAQKYRNVVDVLGAEYMRLHEAGHRVPKFAYLCPFNNVPVAPHKDVGIGTGTVRDHHAFIYRDRRFEPLWFRWEGKPLMLATPDSVPPELADQFTWRTPVAPYDAPQAGVRDWAWMSIHPQTLYKDAGGRVEEIAVGVAQNYVPEQGRTSPMSWPNAMGRNFHGGRNDARPGAINEGLNFQEQWDYALKHDPRFVFVTGWNEWVAQRFDEWAGFRAPPVVFVDLFTQEFSRDAEPMRGGHGDNYYYQLIANVRRYKGVRPIPLVESKPVTLDERFDDWAAVAPEFRDTIGDPVRRDHAGWGSIHFKDDSGRNDLVAAKVSVDATHVHFYVHAAAALVGEPGDDWMTLRVDVDQDAKTGTLGYDVTVRPAPGGTAVVQSTAGPRAPGAWRAVGNQFHLSVPRDALGLANDARGFDFKWADRCTAAGDWTDFTLRGDAAPNDRFNYRAKLR